MLVWPSQVEGQHSIDTMVMTSLGRGRGFKFMDCLDIRLITLIKNKIKALYERFFDPVYPLITIRPGIRTATPVSVVPSILIMPVVKK